MDLPLVDLTEEELDRRVQAARIQQLSQKKRSYLEAIQRGEDPAYSLDLPDPRMNLGETSKQPRFESWGRVSLPTPKYQGKSWTELQTFLVKIESIFATQGSEFASESRRVVYAGTCISGDLERRWTTFVQESGGISSLTWQEAKQWLKDQMADPPTRAFDATQRLDSLYQRQSQTCRAFLDVWESTEAELPALDPELNRVCRVLHRLLPTHREKLVSSGVPATWRELRHEAVIADSFSATNRNGGYQNQNQTNQRHRWDNEGTSQRQARDASPERKNPPADRAAATQRPNKAFECWRCGGPHKLPSCTEPGCSVCGRDNHITSKHALYLDKQWPPYIRDGYGYQQRGNRENPATSPNNETQHVRQS